MSLTKVSAGVLNIDDLYGFRNRIINGDMRIDQRNAGASVTPSTNSYTVDRWIVNNAVASKLTAQQSSTAPTGFTNSLLVTSTSAYSPASIDPFYVSQRVEGFNFSDLMWGTANAKTVILSFWIRSSLTGTFSGSFQNSATDYSYPYTYTISAANTWEYKTVTVAGPTSGTWIGSTNGIGLRLYFSMGAGSTYQGTAGSWAAADYRGATGETQIVATNGATFYITGVQLEVGSVATPFERRPFGTELALCQRYCVNFKSETIFQRYGPGLNQSTTGCSVVIALPVEMRTQPSLTTSGTASHYAINHGSNSLTALNAVPAIGTSSSGTKVVDCQCTVASGLTAGGYGQLQGNNSTSGYLLFTAEL